MASNQVNPIVFLILALCCPSSGWACFQESAVDHKSAAILVSSLSSPDENTRIKSELALLELGPDAIKDLESGSKSVNIEISSRCHRILVRINESVEKEKRKAFLDNPDTTPVPTWKAFTTLFENDSLDARELFLDICATHSNHFEDLKLKGIDDETAVGAVSLARKSVTMLDPNHYRNVNTLVGFLFADSLAQQRLSKFKDSPEVIAFAKQRHLNSLKALNYLAENDRISAGRHQDYNSSCDQLVAKWFRSVKTGGTPSAELSKMKLVYTSLNEVLIEQLADQYESLDKDQKLKFLDIVRHYSTSEKELRRKIDHSLVFRWMSEALEDPTILLTTRLCKQPAKELNITARQFALAIACPLVAKSRQEAKKSLDRAFGSLPLSAENIAILKDKATEAEVLGKITKAGKPNGS